MHGDPTGRDGGTKKVKDSEDSENETLEDLEHNEDGRRWCYQVLEPRDARRPDPDLGLEVLSTAGPALKGSEPEHRHALAEDQGPRRRSESATLPARLAPCRRCPLRPRSCSTRPPAAAACSDSEAAATPSRPKLEAGGLRFAADKSADGPPPAWLVLTAAAAQELARGLRPRVGVGAGEQPLSASDRDSDVSKRGVAPAAVRSSLAEQLEEWRH